LKITLFILLSIVCSIGIIPIGDAFAASHTGVDLGSADSFALLASTITNTNPTIVSGDVGSGTGGQAAPIGTVTGTNHFDDNSYTQANNDLISAITDAQARTCDDTVVAAALLGGSTVQPGVHCLGAAAALTGTLTLNGPGLYIFDITGALTTAAASSVQLTNGATSDDVFWVVTGATTLGAGTDFAGTIISNAAITVGAGSDINGCVLTTGPSTIATSTITCTTTPVSPPVASLPIDLNTAASFGLLASTITNTNPTIVSGDVGSGTGGQAAPIGTVTGTNHFDDNSYTQANNDLISAITDAQARTCDDTVVAAALLGGSTVQPGVHCLGAAAALTGTLTLNGPGLYIFDITGALTTAAASSVQLTNGATPDDIFWVVTGATTLGAGTDFAGTIISNAAITVGAGTTVDGRVLTNALLTIATSTVTVPVVDTTAPIITLVGADPQIIEVGGSYNELGATASDNLDGDITASIVTDSTAVETATLGSYFVTYDVTDANGNSATQVSRTVDIVVDCSLIGPNAILIGCDLSYADLSGAILYGADLTGANLYRTDLTGAVLSYTDLTGTDLTGTYLYRTDLSNAVLSYADLSGVNLRDAYLENADLSNADLTGATLSGANLHYADLSNANLSYADLSGAILSYADLHSAHLSNANLHSAHLSNADLSNADLTDAYLSRAHLSNADLSGANFSDAYLAYANLTGANLTDADLTGADLYGANFSGAITTGCIGCP
jgi:uncharacterized protein YjbI with pentapeptide repeats